MPFIPALSLAPWALLAAWRARPGPRRVQRPADPSSTLAASAPSTRGRPSAQHAPHPHTPPEWQALLTGAPALPPLSDGTTVDPDAPPPHEEPLHEACGWHDSSWTLLQGLIVVEGPPVALLLHPEMI